MKKKCFGEVNTSLLSVVFMVNIINQLVQITVKWYVLKVGKIMEQFVRNLLDI